MSINYHSFHIVEPRPWPLAGSLAAGLITLGGVLIIYLNNPLTAIISLIRLVIVAQQWWRDVRREATLQGHHREIVELGIR